MPQLDPQAVRRMMTRRNLLFKHQIANSLGISYEHLAAALVEGEEVDEVLITRLCDILSCDRTAIVQEPKTP